MSDFASIAASVIPRLANDLGITPAQAAGIIGQLGHESSGLQAINERNPVVPGSRGGFGWAQWTGPRRVAFESWARQNGLPVTSPEANYRFLVHELKNTPEGAVLGRLRGAPDAITAGRIFTDDFLRPGIVNQGSRDEWTRRALAAQGITPANNSSPSAAMQTATDNPAQEAVPNLFAPPVAPVVAQAATPFLSMLSNAVSSAQPPEPQPPSMADMIAEIARAQMLAPPKQEERLPFNTRPAPLDPMARGEAPRYFI